MSHTKHEREDGMPSKDQTESPLIDDGNCGRGGAGGVVLKKGPWTSAEDAILIDYVKKHGEGNWNAVQKHSGLFRCEKSYRLRWANHLRPNLKKGTFTQEEEQLIIELHAKMGNKWARMAAHLPGRTDNEIKNYWNTRIKRRQWAVGYLCILLKCACKHCRRATVPVQLMDWIKGLMISCRIIAMRYLMSYSTV